MAACSASASGPRPCPRVFGARPGRRSGLAGCRGRKAAGSTSRQLTQAGPPGSRRSAGPDPGITSGPSRPRSGAGEAPGRGRADHRGRPEPRPRGRLATDEGGAAGSARLSPRCARSSSRPPATGGARSSRHTPSPERPARIGRPALPVLPGPVLAARVGYRDPNGQGHRDRARHDRDGAAMAAFIDATTGTMPDPSATHPARGAGPPPFAGPLRIRPNGPTVTGLTRWGAPGDRG